MGDVALAMVHHPHHPHHPHHHRVHGRRIGRCSVAAVVASAATVGAVAAVAVRDLGEAVVVAHVVAAVAVVAGVALHRPARPASWALVAVGCVIQAVGAALLFGPVGGSGPADPGTAQAITALAYPALLVGVAGLTARGPAVWSSGPAIVATVVGSGVVLLALTLPEALRDRSPVAESEWGGALGVGDLVIAVVALRGAVHRGRRNWTAWVLAAGFVTWGNGHAEIGAAEIGAAEGAGDSVVAIAVVVGSMLVGLAALLRPSRTVPDDRVGDDRRAIVGTVQVLALVPAALVVVSAAHVDAGRAWAAVGAMAVILVAVRRLASLVAALDEPDVPGATVAAGRSQSLRHDAR